MIQLLADFAGNYDGPVELLKWVGLIDLDEVVKERTYLPQRLSSAETSSRHGVSNDVFKRIGQEHSIRFQTSTHVISGGNTQHHARLMLREPTGRLSAYCDLSEILSPLWQTPPETPV